MRKWIVLIVLAAAGWLAISDSSAAGLRRRPATCCPCPCPSPTYSAETPRVRTITTAKGRVYQLVASAMPADERESEAGGTGIEGTTNPNDFSKVSRKIAKTSYVEGAATEYPTVWKLRESLPSEQTMKDLHIPFGAGSQNSDRVEQEKRNVTVTAFLYAYSRQNDNDYHLIVGDHADDPKRKFMNVEISGLPVSGIHREKLKEVRTKFKQHFGLGDFGPSGYEDFTTPMKVRVTGSLFYDMDHSPPSAYVKHHDLQPKTAWEIHPITDIEFDIEP
jgi:hypothetical protein